MVEGAVARPETAGNAWAGLGTTESMQTIALTLSVLVAAAATAPGSLRTSPKAPVVSTKAKPTFTKKETKKKGDKETKRTKARRPPGAKKNDRVLVDTKLDRSMTRIKPLSRAAKVERAKGLGILERNQGVRGTVSTLR